MENQTAATSDNSTNQTTSVLAAGASETPTQETTTTAPATPAANFQDLLAQDGRFTNDWTNKLPEALKESSKTLAKFKSPLELMTSYVSLEKEFSKRTSEKIKVPGEGASDEDWANYKKAVGAEFKPEDYGLKKPDDVDDNDWDAETVNAATNVAAKYGIPKKAFEELMGVHRQSLQGMVQKAEEYQKQQYEEVMSTLKREMGTSLTSNLQRANRAAAALGLDATNPAIGNNVDIIKALIRVDQMMGEDRVVGQATNNTSTYQEQYDALLRSDAYQGKKGLDAQIEAQNKLRNLHAAMRK